jgi:hypothetical protein
MGCRMYSELFPRDPAAAAALVALVIDEIQEADESDRDRRLGEFLRAAWPSQTAQDQ